MSHKVKNWPSKENIQTQYSQIHNYEEIIYSKITSGEYTVTDDNRLYSVKERRIVPLNRRSGGNTHYTMIHIEGARRIPVSMGRIMYRYHHGVIPKGYRVVCKNGNKQDFSQDNLVLMTSNELGKYGASLRYPGKK